MSQPRESAEIADLFIVDMDVNADERGRFIEVFRKEWFPQPSWKKLQWSRSESKAGVLRGLHYHRRQIDYWHCVSGTLRVGLYDLRPSSPTRTNKMVIDIDQENPRGLLIPSGVAHGFYALTDLLLNYLVDNYYDGSDELGVAWDDPDINLPWELPKKPILSPRDSNNARLRDIPQGDLPT